VILDRLCFHLYHILRLPYMHLKFPPVRAQRRTADREAALVDIAVRAVEMLATASAAAAAAAGKHGSGGGALAAGGAADAAGAELGAAVSGGELPAAQVLLWLTTFLCKVNKVLDVGACLPAAVRSCSLRTDACAQAAVLYVLRVGIIERLGESGQVRSPCSAAPCTHKLYRFLSRDPGQCRSSWLPLVHHCSRAWQWSLGR